MKRIFSLVSLFILFTVPLKASRPWEQLSKQSRKTLLNGIERETKNVETIYDIEEIFTQVFDLLVENNKTISAAQEKHFAALNKALAGKNTRRKKRPFKGKEPPPSREELIYQIYTESFTVAMPSNHFEYILGLFESLKQTERRKSELARVEVKPRSILDKAIKSYDPEKSQTAKRVEERKEKKRKKQALEEWSHNKEEAFKKSKTFTNEVLLVFENKLSEGPQTVDPVFFRIFAPYFHEYAKQNKEPFTAEAFHDDGGPAIFKNHLEMDLLEQSRYLLIFFAENTPYLIQDQHGITFQVTEHFLD